MGARRNVGGPFFDTPGRQVLGPLSNLDRVDGSSDAGTSPRRISGAGLRARRRQPRRSRAGRLRPLGLRAMGFRPLGLRSTGFGPRRRARGYLGGGDMFVGDPNNAGGELGFGTATDLARTPPNGFQACMIGVNCVGTRLAVPPRPHAMDAEQRRRRWPSGVSSGWRFSASGTTGRRSRRRRRAWPGQLRGCRLRTARQWRRCTPTSSSRPTATAFRAIPSNLVTIVGVNEPPVAADDATALPKTRVSTSPHPACLPMMRILIRPAR